MKKFFALLLTLAMVLSLAACGGHDRDDAEVSGNETTGTEEVKDLPTTYAGVETFMYASLDPHVDYYSWHDQKYGLTESLFMVEEDLSISPWLAESLTSEENVHTLVMKDGVCFSNGNALTAEMVQRNLIRLAETNRRFAHYATWTYEVVDDKTLVITTPTVYPTLINEFASPEVCMLDLDNTTDFALAPISTGPFAVESFAPESDLFMVANEHYWGGDVVLEKATWYAMSDTQARLMAMQNGEINAADNITTTDIEIFSMEPDRYNLFAAETNFRQYLLVNSKVVPASVREAIALMVDREAMAAFLPGVLAPASSAFNASTPYGKGSNPARDVDAAKAVLEADGYALVDGVWTKNGAPLTIVLDTYAARNQDTLAVLLQEQLTAFGIKAEVKVNEDPDSTYMSTGDFQVAFYRMNCDKTNDPFPFIEGTMLTGSYQDLVGYASAETDAQIETLRTLGGQERYDMANEMMAAMYESNCFIFLVSNVKNVVTEVGLTNYSVENPNEYYGLWADTCWQ